MTCQSELLDLSCCRNLFQVPASSSPEASPFAGILYDLAMPLDKITTITICMITRQLTLRGILSDRKPETWLIALCICKMRCKSIRLRSVLMIGQQA